MSALRFGLAVALAAVLLSSCASRSQLEPRCAAVAYTGDQPASASALVGTFEVSLLAPTAADPDGHTSVLGRVNDGPSPSLVLWEDSVADGDCRLFTPRVPFCSEACAGETVCAGDDLCQAYPTARDVGTVHVSGLALSGGSRAIALEPLANTYQLGPGSELPFPAFAEGDPIRVEAEGCDYAGFALEAEGVAPLELAARELVLDRDGPLQLRWRAAGEGGSSRIHVKLDISHHGGSKGKIECETDDDGDLDLPADLVAELLDLGVAGYPTVIVTRRTRDAARIAPGRVELTIDARIERAVTIPGLESCAKDEECARGERCRADLTCGG